MLLSFCLLTVHAPVADARGEVALTFDDLPVHGPVPQGVTRTALMRQIVAALERAHVPPTYGFINAHALEESADHGEALEVWRGAGWPLANHTYTHMDLHANSIDAFRDDIIANEPALERLMGDEDWRWFRYPYLREGNTPEMRRAARDLLSERRYRIAQVTVDFQDWAYNEPYVRCFLKRDMRAIAHLKESYLRRAAESIDQSEQASERIYGRNIKHVMLLHVGAFQPVMLPHLLNLLEKRAYTVVTLLDAQSDPAYASDPNVVLPYGTSLLTQMAVAKQVPAVPYSEQQVRSIQEMCR